MRRRLLLTALVACVLSASGCMLIPEEETYQSAPVLRTYAGATYDVTYVTRGDVVQSNKLSCSFVPTKTEVLRLYVGGEYFDEAIRSVGDTVKAGDLVMQLNLDSVQSQIDVIEADLARLALQKRHNAENRALAVERARLASAADALPDALEAVARQYDALDQSVNDQLTLKEHRLAELTAERDKRQLRAGIDGTITYLRKVKESDLSVAGDRYAVISDASTSAFVAETELWPYFAPGDEFTVTVDKSDYEVVVVDAASLGVEAQERKEGKRASVYLSLKEPTFDLEDGDRGSFVLIRDRRLNVLTLPSGAVFTANGQPMVYYTDEAGVKRYKEIETGLDNGKVVEIVSGLEENECVILN